MACPVIYTVGHSTRPIDEFLDLLKGHDIRQLVDVRLIPYSRRNPQFNTESVAAAVGDAGIRYRLLQGLGGRRKSRPDSMNLGWRNAGFRGYADYMQTEGFWLALEALIELALEQPTAIMCAEAVPWRCHRSLIADALGLRGWDVRHIMTGAKADSHAMTPFAR